MVRDRHTGYLIRGMNANRLESHVVMQWADMEAKSGFASYR